MPESQPETGQRTLKVEEERRRVVEVTTRWSETRLDVRQLDGRTEVGEFIAIGDDPSCEFWVPQELTGGRPRFTMLTTRNGEALLELPPGAVITVSHDDDVNLVDDATPGVLRLPIERPWNASIEVGEINFDIRSIEPEALRLPLRRWDWPMISLFSSSMVAHAILLAIVFLTPPPPQLVSLDQASMENRFLRYVYDGEPNIESRRDITWVGRAAADDEQGGRGKRHRGEEGQMGRQDSSRSNHRYGIKAPARGDSPRMSRERNGTGGGGILSALRSSSSSSNTATGNDSESALGSLTGSHMGDSFRYGGVGVRGTGRGGGGSGAGTIGLGSMGTVGNGGGGGGGTGYGRGAGGLRGNRSGSPASGQAAGTLPLPQNGVLASNFVGGRGVEARLSDLLDQGVMVDGRSIRLEAFQERQRLSYPVPSTEAVALYAELERSRIVADGDETHLQISLVARQGEAPVRPRMDVRLVMDRSGSMGGEKWTNAVAAAKALVSRLQPSDTFGLISYSDGASLDVGPCRVGDGRRIRQAIDGLLPGGGTNISEALQLAQDHRPRRRGPNDLGLVVLISDGRANAGLTAPRDLGALARQMFDDDGVLTTAIGLGTDFDEETMLSIAREGNGSYHFVRRPSEIGEILRDELEERAQAVAQALRVRVVLAPGVTVSRVYGSRLLSEEEHATVRATEVAVDQRLARELGVAQDRRQENEEGLRIHLGSFRRGDQHVILMDLDVPAGGVGTEVDIAQVFLDYKDLSRRTNEEVAQEISATRVAERDDALASLNRTVKRTVLAFQAGDALQTAAAALQYGNVSSARQLLAERRELLEAAADLWRDQGLRRDAALIERYETVVARAYPSWTDGDRRTLMLAMNHFADRRMR